MTLIWHTSKYEPDLTCPICRPLDGYMWHFDTDRDPYPAQLYHPQLGVQVWDILKDEPRPHGNHILNCRCSVEAKFVVTEIEEAIRNKLTWAIQTKVLPPAQ